MAAAAHRDGIELIVNSAFRSDAEQAVLLAAHPDPKWVAPPGKSLHRLATELDLGPPSAYAWLGAHAGEFTSSRGIPTKPGTTRIDNAICRGLLLCRKSRSDALVPPASQIGADHRVVAALAAPAITSVPSGAALSYEPTSQAVQRVRRRGWAYLAVGVVLLIGFAFIAGAQGRRDDRLLKDGVRTSGVVVGYRYARYNSHINVRYVANGQLRVSRIWLNSPSSGYAIGEQVEVVYDPRNLQRVRTTKEANDPPGPTWAWIMALILGGGFVVGAIVTFRRIPRWRRLLAVEHWSRYEARPLRNAWGDGIALRHTDSDSWIRLKLGTMTKWHYRRLADQTSVWVAGNPSGGDVVIAPQGGADLFAAGPPRGILGRLWTRAARN